MRALAALRPGSIPPLLAPVPAWPGAARAADLTGEERPPAPPGAVLVLSPAGSAVRDVAQALAAALAGAHADVDGPGEMADAALRAGGAPYVVLLGLAGEVRDGDVVELDDLLWPSVERGEFTGWTGVVFGADPAQLSWVIAKGLSLHRRSRPHLPHLRVWPAMDQMAVRHGPGSWLLRDESLAERVRPLLFERSAGVVSFVAHSRDDAIHLHDTVVCAAGPDVVPDGETEEPMLPVCAFTGRCFRAEIEPATILRARDANVDVVLVNGCMSYRVSEGLVPLRYRLAHGFMAGSAAAYVGTPDLLSGVAKVNELFHIGLEAGLTVGQATAAVNDHLRYESSDLAHFTAVGLPWLRVSDGAPDGPRLGGVVATPGSEAARGALGAALRAAAAAGPGERPQHHVSVAPRTARLLAGTAGAPAPEGVAGRVAALGGLGEVVAALDSVPLIGFRYSRQGNVMVNLREQVTGLAAALQRMNASSDSARLRRRIEVVESSVGAVEEALAGALWERGTTSFFRFHELWGAVMERRQPAAAGRACPSCGRPLATLRAEHPLIPRIAREATACIRCGLVLDRDPSSPVADVRLRCEERWRRRQQVVVTVEIEVGQASAAPASAVAGVYTDGCVRTRIDCPPPGRVVLSRRGVTAVAVTVGVTPEAQLHQQTLNAFVVAGGRIVYASRPVWVRPEAPGTGSA